jgi:CRP-like cAMP-binding protein
MEQGQIKVVTPGETVFIEGGRGDIMYVLLEGAIELRKKVGSGEAVLKTVESPNDFFGEMSLIDGRPRSATAVASKPSRLLVIDGATFENMILTNGKFALKIIKVLSDRIRHSNATIEELIETAPRERFLHGLADFARHYGEKIHDGRTKVAIKELRIWMNSRMGVSLDESDAILAKLIKGEVLVWAPTSAKTNEEVLVSELVLREFDRRGPGSQDRGPEGGS